MAGEYEPARSLAETQLQVQFAILGGLDTQALGILAVDVGLAALAVAASSLLERFWWGNGRPAGRLRTRVPRSAARQQRPDGTDSGEAR